MSVAWWIVNINAKQKSCNCVLQIVAISWRLQHHKRMFFPKMFSNNEAITLYQWTMLVWPRFSVSNALLQACFLRDTLYEPISIHSTRRQVVHRVFNKPDHFVINQSPWAVLQATMVNDMVAMDTIKTKKPNKNNTISRLMSGCYRVIMVWWHFTLNSNVKP